MNDIKPGVSFGNITLCWYSDTLRCNIARDQHQTAASTDVFYHCGVVWLMLSGEMSFICEHKFGCNLVVLCIRILVLCRESFSSVKYELLLLVQIYWRVGKKWISTVLWLNNLYCRSSASQLFLCIGGNWKNSFNQNHEVLCCLSCSW